MAIAQAECDLAAAQVSMQGARYEWACFQAQQAAEKAIKSLLYAEGYRKILTHSVSRTAPGIPEESPLHALP
ncbi:MAG: HEPN domain-containing protein [Methanolinea sp.]